MRFLFLCLFCNFLVHAQTSYPNDYFRSPLDIPLQLSGNFGELRANHFHAGFDLKTNQKEGLNVYAIADGYISRIKISTFGNGKAIYVTHPNGYTSVYGHLQKAVGNIQDYIMQTHYKEKSFEIEMFPKPNELPVTKGQVIALSGNTGGSEGPHLHFEIRDSKTENIINPMFFGYDKVINDSTKPNISQVYAYPLDNGSVNGLKSPSLLNLVLQKDGSYLANKVKALGKVGFGISATDVDNVSHNKNGVFDVRTLVNGKENFGYQFNSFSFDETRYINAFIDYSRYKKSGQRIQKLFMKPPFDLSIIKADSLNGVLSVEPNLALLYKIIVSDFYGNQREVTIPIEFDSEIRNAVTPLENNLYRIRYQVESRFEKDNMSVYFPSKTFYDDFNLKFNVNGGKIFLHDESVPVHNNFTIAITDTTYSKSLPDKTFIGKFSGRNISYLPTSLKGDTFSAKSKVLGTFGLVQDTIAPSVTIVNPIEGKNVSGRKLIQLTISDGLSGIKSYNGYINEKWVLFEYDNKTKKITHTIDPSKFLSGLNELKVEVVDQVGNAARFITNFFYN